MKDNKETKKMELGELNEFSDLDTRFKGWFLTALTEILFLDDADAGELMMAEENFNAQEENVIILMVGELGDKVSVIPMGCYTTFNKAIRKVLSVFINNFTPDDDGKPAVYFNHEVGELRIAFKHNGTNYNFVLAPSYIDCPVATEEELGLNIILSPNETVFTPRPSYTLAD
jgi:hypothetical protein